jgi:hypothetical protein
MLHGLYVSAGGSLGTAIATSLGARTQTLKHPTPQGARRRSQHETQDRWLAVIV